MVVRVLAGVAFMASLGGCAHAGYEADSYVSQQLPSQGDLETTVVVRDSPDAVWQRLIERMAGSALFIEGVDPASRLIIADFTAPNPADYLDCGTAEGAVVERSDTTQTRLRLAEGGRIEWGINTRKHTGVPVETRGSLVLSASLTGGANVHLVPHPRGTRVMVNARYLLQVAQRGTRVSGGDRTTLGLDGTYVFTTHGGETYETTSPVTATLQCAPTGVLENLILQMALG